MRTRWLFVSAMNRTPAALKAQPFSPFRLADVAAPPSPEKPAVPVPAAVVIVPKEEERRRTRLASESAMHSAPVCGLTATPLGFFSCALVPAPPSPESPGTPVPAIVVMMPAGVSLRTR